MQIDGGHMVTTKTINTSGKRKQAIARATLAPGKGTVHVNNQRLDHFSNHITQLKIQEALILAGEKAKEVDIVVRITGGGVNSQADAARVAIARALVGFDSKLKKVFDDYDRLLLVADIRRKESRKPGTHGKARAKSQKSYR